MTKGKASRFQRLTLLRRGLVAVTYVSLAGACEVAVNVDGLTNGQCPAGQKACPRIQMCVPTDVPEYGCNRPGCENPCAAANVQTTTCLNGTCSIASCAGTFSDCDHDFSNGCEADLSSDKHNCNSCGNDCTKMLGPHAIGAACCGGECVIVDCESGYGDCDGVFSTGCEATCTTGCKAGSSSCVMATAICGT